jgi:hypothetical protein
MGFHVEKPKLEDREEANRPRADNERIGSNDFCHCSLVIIHSCAATRRDQNRTSSEIAQDGREAVTPSYIGRVESRRKRTSAASAEN